MGEMDERPAEECKIMSRNLIVAQSIAEMKKLEDADQFGGHAYNICAYAAWQAMDGGQRECLRQLLFHGPVWDGHICSKSARGDLFAWGLATRVCHHGEQGYTAATYQAYTIFTRSGEDAPNVPKSPANFREALEQIINRYSLENGSNTPDFILGHYLTNCLGAFNRAINEREKWYGRTPDPTNGTPPVASPDPSGGSDAAE
jgi:hypothetical protein